MDKTQRRCFDDASESSEVLLPASFETSLQVSPVINNNPVRSSYSSPSNSSPLENLDILTQPEATWMEHTHPFLLERLSDLLSIDNELDDTDEMILELDQRLTASNSAVDHVAAACEAWLEDIHRETYTVNKTCSEAWDDVYDNSEAALPQL